MCNGNGNGNGIECNGVKMESRGKLGNDEKVKFVGPMKRVRWKEKTCGPVMYVNYNFQFSLSFPSFNSWQVVRLVVEKKVEK